MRSERKASWILALLTVVVLLAFLGSRGLAEPDEGRYAEIAREMAEHSSWWVPHLNGFEHFQKPPMIYWAAAGAIRLLGANEWGARLPSALSAFFVVLLTVRIGRRLFGDKAGLGAGFILLSSGGFFALAHLLTPDMLLTFWITAAIACYVEHLFHPDETRWSWCFFVCLGGGFLTKGPMALVVPLCAAASGQWALRHRPERRPLPWIRGVLLALAIGLSWFAGLSLWRGELLDYFWRYELVERFASSAHGRSKPVWFFLPVLLAALLPWSFFLPRLGRRAWARWRESALQPAEWMLIGWSVPPFVVLSLSGSKLPTYILPLLPALALGLAAALRRRMEFSGWLPRLAGAACALWVAAAAILPFLNGRFGQQASLRDLVKPYRAAMSQPGARICAVEVRSHGLEFYTRRLVCATREQSDLVLRPTPEQEQRLLSTEKFSDQALLESVSEDTPVYAVVRKHRFAASFQKTRWEELGNAGDFLLIRARREKLASGLATN